MSKRKNAILIVTLVLLTNARGAVGQTSVISVPPRGVMPAAPAVLEDGSGLITKSGPAQTSPEVADLHRFEYKQVHMGVQARIVLYAPDSSAAEAAARAAFDRIAELDSVMSDYRVDSELTQLTRHAGMGPMPVSDDLFRVLDFSQMLARQSRGAFDVTVGPYVRLWRQARRTSRLPEPDSLAAASALVGFRMLRLDQCARTVTLQERGMKLDLGGIAKGFAADEAIETLRRHAIRSALVEFGGDIVVSDAPPGEKGWDITAVLADPENQEISLTNTAVSTSGDTEQFVDIDGRRYSHIVDPRTGVGLTDRVAVTVIAPSGILSDALATALSVLGNDGLAIIENEYPAVKAYVHRLGK